ncbi:MAG: radical SAM protein [Candidatus Gastranaerophilales bacterium]|nr:radical SAM protein [Candidatus Gastranaerophilales bacterium]
MFKKIKSHLYDLVMHFTSNSSSIIKISNNKEKKTFKYLSCEYIQHGFNVDYEDIKMCCFNCHEGGGRQILIDNYKGEMIDWKKFFKEKRKLRELNKKGIILERCKGCFFLKEREWDDDDYINYMVFNHWTQCNCKCKYCFTNEQSDFFNARKNYNMYPVIKKLADMDKTRRFVSNLLYKLNIKKTVYPRRIRGGGEIGFGGGEPALLPEFEPMVNMLLDCGCDNIRVHSSGVKYSQAIERGLKEGKLTLVVSVDSGTAETYENIKRVNHFNKVWENLKIYASKQGENKYKAKTKYIIYPGFNDNKEELDKWFDLTVQAGIKSVVLDVEGGWYINNKHNIPDYLYELLEYAKRRAEELGMKNVELYDRANDMLIHKVEYLKLRENEQSN